MFFCNNNLFLTIYIKTKKVSIFQTIQPFDNPNDGMNKINENFAKIDLAKFTGVTSGDTIVLPGVNINVVSGGTVPVEYTVNLNDEIALNSISASTIFLKGYNLYSIITGSTGVQNTIPIGETAIVGSNYQYLVYGDLVVAGTLINYGQVIVMNGALNLSGGTFENFGSLVIPKLITGSKYVAAFTANAYIPLNINHGMFSRNIIYSVFDNSGNQIEIDLSIIDANNVRILTTSTIVAEINIIGL